MKKLLMVLFAGAVLFSVSCQNQKKQGDSADAGSEVVKDDGFVALFDGTSLDGWRGVNKDTLPGAWVISEGTLHCIGSGMGEAGAVNGGDILYEKKFSNFHLKFDWKIGEGGNSGVFYLGQEVAGDPIWRSAPEYQVLDNERHLDAQLGVDGNRQSASLYDLIPAKPQNAKPAGEWNTGEIMVYDGTVIHKQNGAVVLEYHLWTPEWNEMVANSKFPEYNPDWAKVAHEGYISFQDHGDDVWYRNILIKEL